jgi:hypothetical protein
MKIATFYHVWLGGYGSPISQDAALDIVSDQADIIHSSGLYQEAGCEFNIGINGKEPEVDIMQHLYPASRIQMHDPSEWVCGEVPTLKWLRSRLPDLSGRAIGYFHMKGISHHHSTRSQLQVDRWRNTMENVVIRRWRDCVAKLQLGYESSGVLWHRAFNGHYWAGNFWWATAEFLSTLPPLEANGQIASGRFEAEVWIGRGPRLPRVFNFPGSIP